MQEGCLCVAYNFVILLPKIISKYIAICMNFLHILGPGILQVRL